MTAKKAADKGMPADEGTVRAYLIEHGGAPYVRTVYEDGSTVESPDYPDPLPTLAQAMKKYPCSEIHGDRYPAVCCNAIRLTKKGAKLTADGIEGASCGRRIPITNLPGLTEPHIGCPICDPYPEGYDYGIAEAEENKKKALEFGAVSGPRRQRRVAQRALKKAAKPRQH